MLVFWLLAALTSLSQQLGRWGFGLKYKSDGVTGVIVATYQSDKL